MSLFFSRQLRKNGIIFSNNSFCKNNLKDLGYNPVVIELNFIHFIIKIINETSRPFWQKNHRFFNMIFKNSRLFNKRSWRAFIFRIYWLRPLLSNDGQTKKISLSRTHVTGSLTPRSRIWVIKIDLMNVF